jgi:thiamine-phosphate pyrophosphorylase
MNIILLLGFYPTPEDHILLGAVFEQGLEYFYLRKKAYAIDEMVHYLQKTPSELLDKIVMNSHFHLVEEFALKGVHFNKAYTVQHFVKDNHLTINQMREKYQHISHSVHSLAVIPNNDFPCEYLFLSPIFDRISNNGYNSQIKILTIRKFFKSKPDHVDVITLIGITAENMKSIFLAGFNGLGILGHKLYGV